MFIEVERDGKTETVEIVVGLITLKSRDGGDIAIVDVADFYKANRYRWHKRTFATNGHLETHYAQVTDYSGDEPKTIKLHRYLLDAPEGLEVDHIDGNGLNNRRENLRLVNRKQNAWNQRKTTKPTTSKYKGVYRRENKSGIVWNAAIGINYKRIHIGNYATEEEAALAYNEKALELFGEYARLNEIEGE